MQQYTYYRRYQPQRRRQRKPSSFRSFFWFVVVLVLVVLLMKTCVSFVQRTAEEKRDEIVLSIEQGRAELTLYGQSESKEAANAQIIHIGDRIETGEDSWVTLSFYNGTQLRLDERTSLTFEEFLIDGEQDDAYLVLNEGRVWMEHLPRENGEFEIELRTDVMNVFSTGAQYLASNRTGDEHLYVMEDNVSVEFVERGEPDKVIESVLVSQGSRALLNEDTKRALLARENVTLIEAQPDGEFLGDRFVMWNVGVLSLASVSEELDGSEESEAEEPTEVEEAQPEPEPEPEPEPQPVEASDPLQISISTPNSGVTTKETAIAIEGRITSGEAQRVTVTWSGNGQPYELGLFEPGASSFRYVADVQYANFAAGENSYTVRAYDAEGNVSNVVTVVIVAEF